jgi:hypothetical protein
MRLRGILLREDQPLNLETGRGEQITLQVLPADRLYRIMAQLASCQFKRGLLQPVGTGLRAAQTVDDHGGKCDGDFSKVIAHASILKAEISLVKYSR